MKLQRLLEEIYHDVLRIFAGIYCGGNVKRQCINANVYTVMAFARYVFGTVGNASINVVCKSVLPSPLLRVRNEI